MRRSQLGARLLERRARRQPAEQFGHAVHAAILHGGGHVMRAGHHVGDDLGFRGIRDRRLEHTNDRHRAVAELDGLADDRFVAVEPGGPEAVGEDRGRRGLRAIVGRIEQPPAHRAEAHHAEVRAADHSGLDDAWVAEADQCEFERREITERANGGDARAKVADLRHREVGVLAAAALRRLPDVDQPLFVVVDERTQQHAAHHAEDRGVGADAERERENDSDGEALDPCQRSKGVANIGQNAHDCCSSPTRSSRRS